MFYVYALLDTSIPILGRYCRFKFDFEPFYIGKGCRDRVSAHVKHAKDLCHKNSASNPHKARRIKKIHRAGYTVEERIIKRFDTEEAAFTLERDLIESIGRRHLQTGPLTNLTDGGEGASGLVLSKKVRKHISTVLRNRSPEAIAQAVQKRKTTIADKGSESYDAWKGKVAVGVAASYANLSEAERKRRYKKASKTVANQSADQKAEIANKKSKATKSRHLRMTDSEKAEVYAKVSASHKIHCAKKTASERKAHRKNVSAGVKDWAASRTDSQRDDANNKRRATWANKSPEELAAFNAKRLSKIDWEAASKKRSATLRARTPEQIQASVEKRLATMRSRGMIK